MDNYLKSVAKFHEAFDHPILAKPAIPDAKRVELRYNLLHEEVQEFHEAALAGDIVAVADAFADIQYVLAGAILEFGLQDKFAPIFDEVQRSNMSKACDSKQEAYDTVMANGGPEVCSIVPKGDVFLVKRDSDDKTIKNINYSPASLGPILEDKP